MVIKAVVRLPVADCRNGYPYYNKIRMPKMQAVWWGLIGGISMARILVADDDSDICGFLKRIMRKAARDSQIEIANDGAEAFEKLNTGPFDLAIIDIFMPYMTGLEVVRAVRRKGLGTKIIVVTGLATAEIAKEAFRAGVQDFLEKPIIVHSIINTVQSLLKEPDLQLGGRENRLDTRATDKSGNPAEKRDS